MSIEQEVIDDYNRYWEEWGKKNKVDISMQRLVRYYLLTKLENLKGIYPSPLSPDLWIRLQDVTLWIDVKTIDTHWNPWDLRETHMEENQTSFDNHNYRGIASHSTLEPIDEYNGQEKPILSYIVKFVYHDTGSSFHLEKNGDYPLIVLVCLPNWKLSNLFNYDIIANYKTYAYYKETDGEYYRRMYFRTSDEDWWVQDMIDRCTRRWFERIPDEIHNKLTFYDRENDKYRRYTTTTEGNRRNIPVLKCIKSWDSVRYKNDILKNRFDWDWNPWLWYKEFPLPNPLPDPSPTTPPTA